MERQQVHSTIEGKHDLSRTRLLQQLHAAAIDNGYSFAMWRLPNDQQTQAILSFSNDLFDLQSSFEEFPSGFLFHPFNTQKKGVLLKADLLFQFAGNELKQDDSPTGSQSAIWLEENILTKEARPVAIRSTATPLPPEKSESEFEDFVRLCLTHINAGDFEKVVPSRCKSVALPVGFDPVVAFQKLSAAYPNALISLVYTPEHGTWLGATPEILVSIEDRTIFKTVALAGTQEYTPGVNLRDVAWTQKEIEEQALVSRYIINCFKKIRLREFSEHGPKTTVAGNLMHLKTDFSVDMKATNFPLLGSVMLRLLHPTSAVCGMPMENSYPFLAEHEGYDRSFYSGFLGPVNFHNCSHLFVNLRCMELSGNHAICYAGAGVTVDSVPEREWLETEVKMNTLLQVIL